MARIEYNYKFALPPSLEAKMLQSETMFPPQKALPKLEHGRYTATNVRWGLALDLDAGDDQMLMSWGYHGRENQQARFFLVPPSCSAGADRRNPRSTRVVGVPSLWCRLPHRQRQEWFVHRSSGHKRTAGRLRGSRHGDVPDVLGSGGHV